MAEETQDGQKTLVAFIVGLLIGGMLVWAFSGPTATAPVAEVENEATEMEDGAEEGEVSDEEEGEVSYQFQMAILDIDLDEA